MSSTHLLAILSRRRSPLPTLLSPMPRLSNEGFQLRTAQKSVENNGNGWEINDNRWDVHVFCNRRTEIFFPRILSLGLKVTFVFRVVGGSLAHPLSTFDASSRSSDRLCNDPKALANCDEVESSSMFTPSGKVDLCGAPARTLRGRKQPEPQL